MANSNKTKAEILQELESIKGLLLEEEDIPILQEVSEHHQQPVAPQPTSTTVAAAPNQLDYHQALSDEPARVPGGTQTSLFDEALEQAAADLQQRAQQLKAANAVASDTALAHSSLTPTLQPVPEPATSPAPEFTFNQITASKPSGQDYSASHFAHSASTPQRPLTKASGENPFLPQHIRERLHGNNPPPLFEYETAKKIISATKNIQAKINRPRQYLIDDVIKSMMPQIESELRQRLYAMNVDELSELLKQDE